MYAAVHTARGLEFAVVAVQCLFHLAEVCDTFVYRTVTRLLAGDIEECFWISHDEQIKKLKSKRMKGEFPQSFIISLLIRDSIIALHFCNLLLQFLHLLLLQHFFVFDRDYLDELVGIAWPVIEHGACQFGTGVQVVLADELVQIGRASCRERV